MRRRARRDIKVCSIVWAELLHGAMKYGVPDRRRTIVRETLELYVSYPFDRPAAERYAAVRHELEAVGQVVGGNDLMIAAIALAHDCTVATANDAEFRRVPGLTVENWLLPPS